MTCKKSEMISYTLATCPTEFVVSLAAGGESRTIADIVSEWVVEYSKDVYDVPPVSLAREEELQSRVLSCWIWHWETTKRQRDILTVAQSLQKGRGFAGNGKLGGNPLFDCVLAVSLIDQQNAAYLRYQNEYEQFLRGQAGKVNVRFCSKPNDIPEWWTGFYTYLVAGDEEVHSSGAAIDSYRGKSGLKNWLGFTLMIYLYQLIRKEQKGGIMEYIDEYSQEYDRIDHSTGNADPWSSCEPMIRKAIDSLDDREFLCLYYIFMAEDLNENSESGKKSKTIRTRLAKLFGVDKSMISRYLTTGLKKFRETFYRECGMDISSGDAILDERQLSHLGLAELIGKCFNERGKCHERSK